MNLEGKIDLIKDSVTDIKQAIIGKGVTPSGNLSTYADAIDSIVTPYNQTKSVTSNGIVRYDEGYTGLEQVTVNVQPNLTTKTITANGTYNASSDSADGYSSVTVAIANPSEDLIDGSITRIDTSVDEIRGGAFKNCEDLDTVVLRSNSVVDLSDDTIFENTPIASKTGNIYVPDGLVDEYKINNGSSNPNDFIEAIQNSNLGENSWYGLAYGNNKFIALGNDGYISASQNGINWTLATQNENLKKSSGSYNWQDLTYDGTKFVAIGGSGYISSSSDGNTWTTSSSSVLGTRNWYSLTYGNSKFIALAINGYISTSTNGTTWTTSSSSVLGDWNWNALIYGNSKFVALGIEGYISTSTDGSTWTTATYNSNLGSKVWEKLTYDGTKFVALGRTGYISTSTDGSTWTTATQNSNLGSNGWQAITYKNKLLALSSTGYISHTAPKYNFLPISQLPS